MPQQHKQHLVVRLRPWTPLRVDTVVKLVRIVLKVNQRRRLLLAHVPNLKSTSIIFYGIIKETKHTSVRRATFVIVSPSA